MATESSVCGALAGDADGRASGRSDRDEQTVGAAAVRLALGLTPHRLSEFTAGLAVDVGGRPNYPRYRRPDVHRMVAAQALRELHTPLEPSLRAALDYGPLVLGGSGWLVVAPAGDAWVVGYVASPADLVSWLRTADGRCSVIDLEGVSARADRRWTESLAAEFSG